ncbi:MAG: hypothetical protein EAZ95_03775 [Bacteroidetes bacterium]|nr:MAG: hypothetical protein EAZ95_03775 [Bacteroidota bacterium]
MQNDPELNGKYLGSITQDFVKIAHILREASYQLRKRNISQFPIFPVTKQPIAVGELLISRAQGLKDWDCYFSFLEQFVGKGLIQDEAYFKATYKDAEEFCCLFVVDTENNFTNFVFVPFPDEDALL